MKQKSRCKECGSKNLKIEFTDERCEFYNIICQECGAEQEGAEGGLYFSE